MLYALHIVAETYKLNTRVVFWLFVKQVISCKTIQTLINMVHLQGCFYTDQTHFHMKSLINYCMRTYFKWSRIGAEMKVLVSHQCGLGLMLAQCHVWVEFVVGYCLALKVFLWVVMFSSLHENQHLQIPTQPG